MRGGERREKVVGRTERERERENRVIFRKEWKLKRGGYGCKYMGVNKGLRRGYFRDVGKVCVY